MNDSSRNHDRNQIGIHVRCPHCRNPIEFVSEHEFDSVNCPSCGSGFNLVADETKEWSPENLSLGHFILKECVGHGAFGVVWKAFDPELDRHVAIKLPRAGQFDPQSATMFARHKRFQVPFMFRSET